MSNDIRTGSLPVNIASNNSHKNSKAAEQSSNTAPVQAGQVKVAEADTVSMTDQVSRLQEIENLLAAIPPVNDALVAEIGQAIADGTIEINLDRIASNLIEIESGILNGEDN